MVQRVIRQLGESDLKGHVTVATSLSQADVIYNQLGEYIDVVVEPEKPAVCNALFSFHEYTSSVYLKLIFTMCNFYESSPV